MKYNWTLNEVASAGRENLDPAHAAEYDRKEDANADAELEVLRQLGLSESSEVVELGAGTGQFTLAAAPVCARVVAVDVSPVMLTILKNKVREAGLKNVDIVQSGFLTYAHQRNPADFLYFRFALHHGSQLRYRGSDVSHAQAAFLGCGMSSTISRQRTPRANWRLGVQR